ncbi:hypothetical protein IFM89_039188 [Coptis chinensis]|uniref:DUF4283 domain-containing protein n=1 Tax=Coptis chinensis TaxID=261450 RepID=A0A835H9R6_9MAGN|nr:hypothetical protein IFM89_039188 [Coptis chinensis]
MAGRTQQTGVCFNPPPMNWSSLFGNSSSNLYYNGNLEWIESDLEQDAVDIPDDILDKGCRVFVIRPWIEDIEVQRKNMNTLPIWVKLWSIPKQLWTKKGISLIASRIGKTSFFGAATTRKGKWLDFAKVCIEVPVNAKYPDCLRFNLRNGNIAKVGVEYLWLPTTCTICKKIGHKDHNRPSNVNSASNANNAENTRGAKTAANTIGGNNPAPLRESVSQHNNGVVDNHVVRNSAQVPNSVAYEPDSRAVEASGQCRSWRRRTHILKDPVADTEVFTDHLQGKKGKTTSAKGVLQQAQAETTLHRAIHLKTALLAITEAEGNNR